MQSAARLGVDDSLHANSRVERDGAVFEHLERVDIQVADFGADRDQR